MQSKYIITGGKPLHGDVTINGAKNATWKLMIAALLTDQEVTIYNAARILDVDIAADIIKALGGRVEWVDKRTVTVCGQGIHSYQIPPEFGEASRASLLFLGPLLHRFGKAEIPLPGGDKIGKRPIERHLQAFEALGVIFSHQDQKLCASSPNLVGTMFSFAKNTHTGTENLIILATMAKGETIIQNAALEPEIDNLIELLNEMGANIHRQERTIVVDGASRLTGGSINVIADRNQVVTFAAGALMTKGDVTIRHIHQEHLTAFLEKLADIGAGFEIETTGSFLQDIRVFYKGPLKATAVTTGIYPGFMTDWQALWAVLMTQAKGDSVIHERIYENRFGYVPILEKMGAQIELFNPAVPDPASFYNFNLEDSSDGFRAARISGPTILKPTDYEVTDLRAGATVVLAALTANGTSTITGIEQIERGYQDFDTKLEELGAKIDKE